MFTCERPLCFRYCSPSASVSTSFSEWTVSASSFLFHSSSCYFFAFSLRFDEDAIDDHLGCRFVVKCFGQFGNIVGTASSLKYGLANCSPFFFLFPRSLEGMHSKTISSFMKCLLQMPTLFVISHFPQCRIFPFHSSLKVCIVMPVMSTFLYPELHLGTTQVLPIIYK